MLAALASQSGAGSGGLTGLSGDLLGLKNSGALFIGILRSQTAQDRLVGQFGLKTVYREKLTMDARTKLDQNTVISEDRKSGIISISVIDRSPQRAAAIANAYVVQLNALVSELSTSAAHRERVFLEERLVVVKRDLDDATNQLAQFSSKSNTLDIQTEGRAMLDAAGALSGQLIAAQSELEGLRQIYAEDNARVRALNARVSELRTQLARLGGSAGAPAGSTKAASDAPGSLPYPSIRSLPLLGAQYADYFRRAKIQETVFQLLTEQSELAKVEEAKETPSVKVLDPAQVPERKSAPARLTIMLLGTLLAFSVAVVWVLGANQWSLADSADPRKILVQEIAETCTDPKSWFAPASPKPQADMTPDVTRE
jgi:capsule polysaccharide export protein KpsE/RkpR